MLNLVSVKNNQPVTTSLKVATVFGKRHSNLLRKVKNLTTQNRAVRLMFSKGTYTNERNRKYSIYYMNRDGFALLVMGFIGKKALKFKLAYIGQFDQMQRALQSADHTFSPALQEIKDEIDQQQQQIKGQTREINLLTNCLSCMNSKFKQLPKLSELLKTSSEQRNCRRISVPTVPISKVASHYEMSAQEFNFLLSKVGLIYRRNNTWRLTKNVQNKHLAFYRNETLYWTRKGVLVISKVLACYRIYVK